MNKVLGWASEDWSRGKVPGSPFRELKNNAKSGHGPKVFKGKAGSDEARLKEQKATSC